MLCVLIRYSFLIVLLSFSPLCANEEVGEEDKKEIKSPHTIQGTVTFLTDYRSRGISQTMLRPAVQGEIKYSHESGFYGKAWASNIDGTSNFITNTSTEWNFYFGFEHAVNNSEFKYDIGCIIYYFPGGKAFVPQGIRYNTVEYYIGLNYKGFNVKLWQTINDYYGVNSDNPPFNWRTLSFSKRNGHSYGSPYVEANYEWELCPKWSAGLHVGYQAVIHYSELNYLDWQVSLTREFEWFNLALYYISTNARHAFYDVPDHLIKPNIRKLGGPGIIGAIYREF